MIVEPFFARSPAFGDLADHLVDGNGRVRDRLGLHPEPVVGEGLTGLDEIDADDVGHRHGAGVLPVDLREGEDAAHHEHEHEEDDDRREEPARAAAARAVGDARRLRRGVWPGSASAAAPVTPVSSAAAVVAIIAVTGVFASGRPRRKRRRSARRSSADW